MPLFLLIAQQRSACAYITDTPHLKMLGELYDRCQETLDQFQSFIAMMLTPVRRRLWRSTPLQLADPLAQQAESATQLELSQLARADD